LASLTVGGCLKELHTAFLCGERGGWCGQVHSPNALPGGGCYWQGMVRQSWAMKCKCEAFKERMPRAYPATELNPSLSLETWVWPGHLCHSVLHGYYLSLVSLPIPTPLSPPLFLLERAINVRLWGHVIVSVPCQSFRGSIGTQGGKGKLSALSPGQGRSRGRGQDSPWGPNDLTWLARPTGICGQKAMTQGDEVLISPQKIQRLWPPGPCTLQIEAGIDLPPPCPLFFNQTHLRW
jgi:hypothetical protein